jgi:RNA polymerase sigma factor (sigma-70 family)
VQQTFLSALEAMRADDRELQLGAWLHRIAHNAAIDALRKPDASWEQLDERLGGVLAPDQVLERRDDLRCVLAGLSRLPERQRQAMVLRELEGRSYEEIAAGLGGTRSAVRQLLNRARNALRTGAAALIPTVIGRMPPGTGRDLGPVVAEVVSPSTGPALAKGSAAVVAAAAALAVTTGGAPEHGGTPIAGAGRDGALHSTPSATPDGRPAIGRGVSAQGMDGLGAGPGPRVHGRSHAAAPAVRLPGGLSRREAAPAPNREAGGGRGGLGAVKPAPHRPARGGEPIGPPRSTSPESAPPTTEPDTAVDDEEDAPPPALVSSAGDEGLEKDASADDDALGG